jgi:hypothetical protein
MFELSMQRCRVDLERWVHDVILSLRCDRDILAAARRHEGTVPPADRHRPMLSNERLPFLPEGVDLVAVYECAAAVRLLLCWYPLRGRLPVPVL